MFPFYWIYNCSDILCCTQWLWLCRDGPFTLCMLGIFKVYFVCRILSKLIFQTRNMYVWHWYPRTVSHCMWEHVFSGDVPRGRDVQTKAMLLPVNKPEFKWHTFTRNCTSIQCTFLHYHCTSNQWKKLSPVTEPLFSVHSFTSNCTSIQGTFIYQSMQQYSVYTLKPLTKPVCRAHPFPSHCKNIQCTSFHHSLQ